MKTMPQTRENGIEVTCKRCGQPTTNSIPDCGKCPDRWYDGAEN